MTDTSKLRPSDGRVRRETATVRGKRYSYVVGEPAGGARPLDTVVLVHGFPDLGFGWRHQVPHLMGLGYRVVVPDMLGYGASDSPAALRDFSLKSVADDVAQLAARIVGPDGQIVLGGHDWGGALVWRVALWHPRLVKAVFSVCTPYGAPKKDFVPLEKALAAGYLTNFRYQLQFKGPDVERAIQGEDEVRQFLSALHGGVGQPGGDLGFTTEKGVIFENLPKLHRPRLMSQDELDYYVSQYMLHEAPRLRGPLNWYRTAEINFEDELPLANRNATTLDMPTLYIGASNDTALPPALSAGMEDFMPRLTRGEVKSSHWALTQAPDDVNRLLAAWLRDAVNVGAKTSL